MQSPVYISSYLPPFTKWPEEFHCLKYYHLDDTFAKRKDNPSDLAAQCLLGKLISLVTPTSDEHLVLCPNVLFVGQVDCCSVFKNGSPTDCASHVSIGIIPKVLRMQRLWTFECCTICVKSVMLGYLHFKSATDLSKTVGATTYRASGIATGLNALLHGPG